ncbi:hypothetical protein PTSG_05803 [Salpingoeca rosetta]|uniref:Uncharacterized protein n=1 Tax=Salpingoeca rosetta (strain ATCC 50818 / BSB-021) TaxID=946362 RepID=F2UCU3_SALR5|nr:uncharacterized protein PTSG_05803 [Salpingoeca rosetta]EGD74438.1 hypothetical protein PTSG_05803 [Salpingoeca rosetta]|eukprot:XP_004992695.1 hypothetical protein PTSG_05803 [Salpingoeca rosetta]
MLLVTLNDVQLPFVVACMVEGHVQLSNPEEDISLGQPRYCPRIDGPDLQQQFVLPDHVSDPARKAVLCTTILVNGATMATSQRALQFPPEGRQFVVFQDFWRAALRRNAQEVRVGRFSVTVRRHDAQVYVPGAPSSVQPEEEQQQASPTDKHEDTDQDKANETTDAMAAAASIHQGKVAEGKSNADGTADGDTAAEANAKHGASTQQGNETSSTSTHTKKEGKDGDDGDNDDDDRPTAQRPPSAASRRDDKSSVRSMSIKGKRDGDDGDDVDDGELPAEAQTVGVGEGLPTSMLRENTGVMSADDVAKLVSSYDALTHAIRKAAEELQLERQRQGDLDREHRRVKQMLAENNASMQVELSMDTMPTLSGDELVSSYLRAADTYSALIAEKRALTATLTSVQNELIQRRNEEAQLLTLRDKHAVDCKNTHNLQAALRRAKQYRALWSQQHQVIRELEKAIQTLSPSLITKDTMLEGVRHQRSLAQNLALHRAWIQANRQRRKQQQAAAKDNEDAETRKGSEAAAQAQSSAPQPRRRQPTVEEATTLATLRERKRSLQAQLKAAAGKHRQETQQLQAKLSSLLEDSS